MFYFLSEWFRRIYRYWFPLKTKKEKVDGDLQPRWDPMDVDPSLQTIDLSRGSRLDFYKTFRTKPRLRHVLPSSVYNTYSPNR